MWKPEQHRLTPKYDILRSLVPPVKHYFVTMDEDGNQFKITCKRCNDFETRSVRSGEMLYIIFLHYGIHTIWLHPGELVSEIFYFQGHVRTKMQRLYHKILKKKWQSEIIKASRSLVQQI